MAGPLFLLQIVENAPPYAVVRFPAGGLLERDFIATCTEAIVARGVGLLKTEAHVRADIAAGITEAILSLKLQTRTVVG